VVKISTMCPNQTHTKPVRAGNGRPKTTEPTVRGRTADIGNAFLVPNPSVGQSRRKKLLVGQDPKIMTNKVMGPVMVPVLSYSGKPLMPTHPARARELEKSGRAVRRWFRGIFCIKLLDRAKGNVQQIAVGVDPGSKREAMTVKSKQHTYLNILSDAVTHVSGRVEERRNARRARRFRKMPCRQNRSNRNINSRRLPPSTKSRWQIKLNILNFLRKLYPVSDIIVEDIKAVTKKGGKRWNTSFSPLEVGKKWFYSEVSKFGNLTLKQGFETFEMRNILGLKKSSQKLAETFESHNVDSWVLANAITDGHTEPENKSLFRVIPLQLHRRQLHRFKPGINGVRKLYGGTMSMGMNRGSVMNHARYGMVYVGGSMGGKVSLHDLKSGRRLTQNGTCKDSCVLYLSPWRTQFLPWLKPWVSCVPDHEKNKSIDKKYKGEPWKDKGYVSWLLWGGDSGRAWVSKILKKESMKLAAISGYFKKIYEYLE
jgi:hypothetical protein